MTKISKKAAYPIKKPVKRDYFIGTDSENFNKTVNFDFEDATAVINELNGQSVIGYQFKTATDVLVGVLEEAEFYSLGNETTISDITKLYVNKFTKNSLNLSNLYNYLLVNIADFLFKLQGTDPNVYVYFNLASIENHSSHYVFNVTLYKGNAVLPELINFGEYFFNFELKSIGAGSGSDPLKLDKAGYAGNAENLDDRIVALENATLPDAVLKFGEVVVDGNTATIAANGFQWRLSQIEHLVTPSYSTPINNATSGFYRSDLVVGDTTGNFSLIEGDEDEITAPEPLVPDGFIKLALIPIFGSTVGAPLLLPNYDDKFLKRYKTTYKTSQPIFYISPSEDDYNVIFTGSGNSLIRIELNGTLGKYIKNGAIYPFKNRGLGTVTVNAIAGVTVNAPNGLILNSNQQCYLIKDDYNEWTFINPISNILEGFIPLTGTTVGNPVSGAIETNSEIFLKTTAGQFSDDGGELIIKHPYGVSLRNVDDTTIIGISGENISIKGESINSRGIISSYDYSPNITDLDYPQKIYVDKKQEALVSGDNIKTKGGISLLGSGDIPESDSLTTTTSITSSTLTNYGHAQNGKIIKIDNGANVINYTVNGLTASFVKGGTGAITFVQGAGRTLTGANGTLVFNGAINSSASIVSNGTVDVLYINNL